MDKMVNNPVHYQRNGHPQCIELMEDILVGYRGVAAFDIGQIKYIYRFGDKPEKGMTRKQKMIQDVNKFGWYVNDFETRAKALINTREILLENLLPMGFKSDRLHYDVKEIEFIANEFADDKKEEYQPLVRSIVYKAYYLCTFSDVRDLKQDIAMLSEKINEIESED